MCGSSINHPDRSQSVANDRPADSQMTGHPLAFVVCVQAGQQKPEQVMRPPGSAFERRNLPADPLEFVSEFLQQWSGHGLEHLPIAGAHFLPPFFLIDPDNVAARHVKRMRLTKMEARGAS